MDARKCILTEKNETTSKEKLIHENQKLQMEINHLKISNLDSEKQSSTRALEVYDVYI